MAGQIDFYARLGREWGKEMEEFDWVDNPLGNPQYWPTSLFYYFSFSGSPLRNDQGEITGILVTIFDNSEKIIALKTQKESRLLATNVYFIKKLKEKTASEKQREEFLQLASHELKTPLTFIKG